MSFTSWATLRSSMKDALADHYATGTFTGSYKIGDRQIEYKSESEFWKSYEMTYKMEALESAGDPSQMVSYGRARRFR